MYSKPTIQARNREHLRVLIEQEIQGHGSDCSLNHIDVSNITDMSKMFFKSSFNGDISQWNISAVKDINQMFTESAFRGDLRPWNLTETQMAEAFKATLPNYLAIRQSIEDAEKLHATFGPLPRIAKKAL